ncbi:hypothetical protein I6E81_12490 [Salinibacterium sp. NG22]|uniref:hypothetical protein n=1 Tax=Salinibacterium sp. NG22 TaxID=2792040 RepID=UPI0018CCCF46|nr:hypothetical protein [Salinibacterium sp. NG22]MBH0110987.1 hypothetical protein [Salinibacterium sp. NG22]
MAGPAVGYESYPEVQQLHRSIGGYTTNFSELISSMRNALETFLAPPDMEFVQPDPLLRILFVSMTAKPISDAFFAMTGSVAELDERGKAIRRTLRNSVSAQISFRNDIAHADWSLGWEIVDTGERVPDTAFKTKSIGGELQHVNLNMGTNTIIRNINLLQELTESVRLFGEVCRDVQCAREPKRLHELKIIPAASGVSARVHRIRREASS